MKSSSRCIALLAHVDAGKTTLSENILYRTGVTRHLGRVDHGDSYFDTEPLERERGITIFSKQADFEIYGHHFTLLDTPGHVDFSAEMERTLSVLDYAVLIISAPDGVKGHDMTLMRLLKTYRVPVIVFVNKMDQPGTDRDKTLKELKESFGSGFVDFTPLAAGRLKDAGTGDGSAEALGKISGNSGAGSIDAFYESVAVLDDALTERYLETGAVDDESIRRLILERKLFPCCFGSALKGDGVDVLLRLLSDYTLDREFPDEFCARVYKISYDQKGNRLVHIRVTGGKLKPRDTVKINMPSGKGAAESPGQDGETGRTLGKETKADLTDAVYEKADRILLISGQQSTQISEAFVGMTVAVGGLKSAASGSTLGAEPAGTGKVLVPLFASKVVPPDGMDVHVLYDRLKVIEDEIPEISLNFSERSGEISMRLMGEVQNEVIRAHIEKRLGLKVDFSQPSIVYRETVTRPVLCAGHFEPLRHYAEVHLLIEPLERGSGIEIASVMSEDALPRHFQRLIMTNIAEKKHLGVLTGSELTDVSIKLTNAKTHEKHTEGGDLREASYRAVRQGLMKAAASGCCALLEPYYAFELTVPESATGRVMTDISGFSESFDGPVNKGNEAVFTGRAAVSKMQGYSADMLSYTGGFGRLSLRFDGYGPCRDAEAVIEAAGYEPELDIYNQSGSVFCAHGAGYYVQWNEADAYMHVDSGIDMENAAVFPLGDGENSPKDAGRPHGGTLGSAKVNHSHAGNEKQDTDYLGAGLAADRELQAIFNSSLSGNRGRNPYKSESAGAGRTGWNGRAMQGKAKSGSENEAGIGGKNTAGTVDSGSGSAKSPAGERVSLKAPRKQYLLVDGYNIIFAWEALREQAALSLDSARETLKDILANYQGFMGMTLILVFDAYKVKGGRETVEKYHNIYVVYTREAQTADAYIEQTVHELGKKERVTVATSDGLEQAIVFGEGAVRMSAAELYESIEECRITIAKDFIDKNPRLENRMNRLENGFGGFGGGPDGETTERRI